MPAANGLAQRPKRPQNTWIRRTDHAALTFLTMTTKPSFRADFKAGEGGKTSVYMARWVKTQGEKGPWSEVTRATAGQPKFKSPQFQQPKSSTKFLFGAERWIMVFQRNSLLYNEKAIRRARQKALL